MPFGLFVDKSLKTKDIQIHKYNTGTADKFLRTHISREEFVEKFPFQRMKDCASRVKVDAFSTGDFYRHIDKSELPLESIPEEKFLRFSSFLSDLSDSISTLDSADFSPDKTLISKIEKLFSSFDDIKDASESLKIEIQK